MSRLLSLVGVILIVMTVGCTGILADSTSIQFQEQTEETGFRYMASDSRTMNAGAGVYVGDVNNDYRPDVLLIGGRDNTTATTTQPDLFVNTEEGFESSRALPTETIDYRTINAAHFFDYDNDGWIDLLLLPIDEEPILLHNQRGDFEVHNLGLNTDLDVPLGATSADFDQDGDLDLFIYQNGDWQTTTPMGYRQPGSNFTEDNGNPNLLFENTNSGFERVTDANVNGNRWTLAASFTDLTGDGWADIHVANDYNADYIYVNQQNGSFRQVPTGRVTDRNGMSSEIADINGDTRPDVFVTNIYFNESNVNSDYTENYLRNVLGKRAKGNNLLMNNGGVQFQDKADTYGVRKGGWGWAAVITDLDNDGELDLIHATQEYSRTFLVRTFNTTDVPSYYQYPALWLGGDNGFTQLDSSEHGLKQSNTRGMAVLDFNRDGSQDLITTQWSQGKYRLYENTGATDNWLQIRVKGNQTQTPINAKVYVTTEEGTRMQINNAKSDYLSQDSRTLHFGLGDEKQVQQIKVIWPDGTTHSYSNLDSNQLIVVSIDGEISRHVWDN